MSLPTFATSGGQPSGYVEPTLATPQTSTDTQAPESAGNAAPASPTQDPSTAAPSSGGGGIFGWIDKTAKDVGSDVGKIAGAIPGVKPVTDFLNRAYTDIVSHPLATYITMGNEAGYQHDLNPDYFFSSSHWDNAWRASNNISPGQAAVISFNDQAANAHAFGATPIDPEDASQVQNLFARNSVASLVSGSLDIGVRTWVDPTAIVAKGLSGTVADIKNVPVSSSLDTETAVNSARGQRVVDQVAGAKSFTQLTKLKFVQASPVSYTLASALHAAGSDRAMIAEVLKVAMNDQGALDRLAMDEGTIAQMRNAAMSPTGTQSIMGRELPTTPLVSGRLAAARMSSILSPADLTMNSALTDADPGALDANFAQGPALVKAEHAQLAFDEALVQNELYRSAAGSMLNRTTGDYLPTSGLKARLALATPSVGSRGLLDLKNGFYDSIHAPTTFMQVIHNHVADPIIRIYHSLSDQRPTNTIEFGTQSSVNQVRSLLNTSTILDGATKDSMIADYARANVESKAAAQLAFTKIENDLHKMTAEHYGLDASHGDAIYQEFAMRRGLYTQGVTSRAYGVIDGNAIFPSYDQEVVADPFLETQLARGATPMANMSDYELALQRMNDSGLLKHVHKLGDKGHQALIDGLDKFYGVWKPLTLLTGHRAFNHIGDDQLRAMTKTGALSVTRNVSKGAADFVRNHAPLSKGMITRNLEGKFDQEVGDLQATYDAAKARYASQQQRLAAGEQIAPQNLVKNDEVVMARRNLQLKKDAGPPVPKKLRLGEGTFRVRGSQFSYPEIFGGSDGAYLRILTSADKTMHELYDKSAVNDFNSQGMLADNQVIRPSDGLKPHAAALQRYINNQLTNDTVAKMMYAGKTDAEIRQWMLNSTAGMKRMRDLHIGNPQDNIEQVRDAITRYLPSHWLKAKAFSSKITNNDLEQMWPDASSRPAVSGNLAVLPHSGAPNAGYFRAATTRMIKFTGTLPDDILVRHPLANDLYKTNMTDLVERAVADGRDVPVGGDVYNALHRQAIQQTTATMQKTLYDSSRFVGAGATLRNIIPFFNAWHNALSSWSKLIVQNPQLIVRGLEAKHALWNAPFAVDTTTGEKANDNTSLANLGFVMHLSPRVAKDIGLGDMSDITISADKVVSPTYADSVGNPGFGPLVQVPVNQLVKDDPTLINNPFVQQILGGRIAANDYQMALPSAVGELGQVVSAIPGLESVGSITGDGTEQASMAQMEWSLYQEQSMDYATGKRSAPPNWGDIQTQARLITAIGGLVSRAMPLGYTPTDRYKFLTDAYQQMYLADPTTADENFYDKYGSAAFVYAQSLGKDVAGVAPTAGALAVYKQYQGLINKFPELGSVVVGPEGNGSFNDMAYQWEEAMGLRTKLTPQQAAAQSQTNEGWVQFDKINANINAQLAQRGLTSVNQKGAEDLKALKTQFVNATGDPTSQYYNQAFNEAYGSFDPQTYEQRILALEQISTNPTLLANPARSDIKALNSYFQMRAGVVQALQQRKSAGQSGTLTAAANSDLAQYYDYSTAAIVQGSTTFGPLYERYLSYTKDNFTEF